MNMAVHRLPMIVLVVFCTWLPAGCMDNNHPQYKEMATVEVKTRLEGGESLLFLAFETGERCGYQDVAPVVTFDYPPGAGQRQKLRDMVTMVAGGRQQLIIICPRHREEAKRVYDFLAQEGMNRDRLYILLEGREKWPY